MDFGGEGGDHLVHAGGELLQHGFVDSDAVAFHGREDGEQGPVQFGVELVNGGVFS